MKRNLWNRERHKDRRYIFWALWLSGILSLIGILMLIHNYGINFLPLKIVLVLWNWRYIITAIFAIATAVIFDCIITDGNKQDRLQKNEKWIVLTAMISSIALAGYGIGTTLYLLYGTNDEWTSYPIAHAMGEIDGYQYTNSLEAFELNYEAGHRVFEVDFQLTSDDKLVCWHDWDSEEWNGEAPTLTEFLETPIYGTYTALSIKELLPLMLEYDDIYIVTDTKYTDSERIEEEFQILMNTAVETKTTDVLDRMIVQIYNEEMYDIIKDIYDFPYIIYTLYNVWDGTNESFEQYLSFCRENEIPYITIKYYLATSEILEMADI